MAESKTYPAIKGVQAGKEYYTIMVPLGDLQELFESDDVLNQEAHAQRQLKEARLPKISDYIVNNRSNYVFSSLAASTDGDVQFRPVNGNGLIGEIEMRDVKLRINDGQHRRAGIIRAIKEDASLINETISIVLYTDADIARSKQMFVDLNKNAVKACHSISESFDSRDAVSICTQKMIDEIDFLRKYTDRETDNLGKTSRCLYTFHVFIQANKEILGKDIDIEKDTAFLTSYWRWVFDNITPLQTYIEGNLTKDKLREDYLCTKNVMIKALGIVGQYFYNNKATDFSEYSDAFRGISWKRTAGIWRNRVVKSKTQKIITNTKASKSAAIKIKEILGLPLTRAERNFSL